MNRLGLSAVSRSAVTLRACEVFGLMSCDRDGTSEPTRIPGSRRTCGPAALRSLTHAIVHPVIAERRRRIRKLLCGGDTMGSQHAISLQDIVGERVQEHHGRDLDRSAYVQANKVPVAPAGMDALADGSLPVLRLSFLAHHSGSPGEDARAVASAGLKRIGTMLGFRRRAV